MHLARLLPRCTSTSLSKSVRSFQSSSFSFSSSSSVVRKQQKRKSWFARHLPSNTTNFTTSSRSASGSTTPASHDGGDDAGYTSKFVHAVSFLPHPDKGEHGEDAYFISDNDQIAGVADGVGGWIEMGIDAGAFSRELMNNAKDFAKKEDSLNPGDILASAYFSTTALGTCTACIIALDGEELRAINVGDSGFSILRRQVDKDPSRDTSEINDDPPQWALYFQTTEQTHFFNCPFQLGTNSRDSPSDGQQFHLPMEHGDLIILATDGVIDNIFTAEMIQMIHKFEYDWCIQHKQDPTLDSFNNLWQDQAAVTAFTEQLGHRTQVLAKDEVRRSPFTVNAATAGYAHVGGKLDDITCVVAVVSLRD